MLALLLVGCSDPGAEADRTLPSAVVEQGSLVVCTEPPYAPFVIEEEDGEVTGFEIELLQRMAAGLDLDLEVRPTPYAALDDGRALAGDRCDVAAGALLVTDERRERMRFLEPHYDVTLTLLVPSASDVAAISDLAGRRLAVQEGTTAQTMAEELAPDGTIVEAYPGDQYMFDALRQGRVDGVLQDESLNQVHTRTGRFTVVDEVRTGEQYAFAVRRDAVQLRRALDRQLERLRQDGTYRSLHEKYLGGWGRAPRFTWLPGKTRASLTLQHRGSTSSSG